MLDTRYFSFLIRHSELSTYVGLVKLDFAVSRWVYPKFGSFRLANLIPLSLFVFFLLDGKEVRMAAQYLHSIPLHYKGDL